MDAPTSSCPTCGTPRGPYDRFCTGCADDLGAPGAPIGTVGRFGVMNVAGPSSRQARAGTVAPRAAIGGRLGRARGRGSRPFAQAPSAPLAPGSQLSAMGSYPATGATSSAAYRLWRTLGIANRAIAVAWLVIVLAALASTLRRPDPDDACRDRDVVLALFALSHPWFCGTAAPGLMRGDPVWLRSIVLIEMMVVVIATLGLALVPLLLIFVVAGDEP